MRTAVILAVLVGVLMGWDTKAFAETPYKERQDAFATSRREESKAAKKEKTKNTKPPRIGLIKRDDLAGECGCYFQLPSKRKGLEGPYVFLSGMDAHRAWMNIDGQDVGLELVKSENDKPDLKNGDRYQETYKAGDTIVQIRYVVTRACEPSEESCEFTYMDATVTAKRGARKQTIRVTGGCGC